MPPRKNNIRQFLIRNYLFLFAGTAASAMALGSIILILQIRSLHTLYINRLHEVVSQHRNELLNEIALNDQLAISQHLDILRTELALDSVALQFGQIRLEASSKSADSKSGSGVLYGLVEHTIGIKPLVLPVSSDFETFNAVLTISYRSNFIEWIVSPLIRVSISVFIFALISVGLIFWILYRKIYGHLVDPLQRVTRSFNDSTGGNIQAIVETELEEIRALADASMQLRAAEHAVAFSEIAQQVSHDIRSPLTALETVMKDASTLPEDQRVLVRSATARIRDIANDLLLRDKAGTQRKGAQLVSAHLMSALVEQIVSEKRVQYRASSQFEIEAQVGANSFGLFGLVAPADLKRVISNLIDNSVEAMDSGRVTVALTSSTGSVMVTVRDNGRGMPEAILREVGRRGVTFGKSSTSGAGSGLGLAHAISQAHAWGGSLEVASEEGIGTEVRITIPRASPPSWFEPEIVIEVGSTPVIVDDDLSIVDVWARRFLDLGVRNYLHFASSDSFRQWYVASRNAGSYFYLFDFELLGSKETGLDLIESLDLAEVSVLVTSRFEEEFVQQKIESLQCSLLPKGLASIVPIRLADEGSVRALVVLVDDDPTMRDLWEYSARRRGKNLLAFKGPGEILQKLPSISRHARIYIDSDLGAGVLSGESLAQELYSRGYRKLYLSTGSPKEKFAGLPWILEVVGKDPPWL